MAKANVLSGSEEMIIIVYAFHRGLTGNGLGYNVGRCVATMLKIINAFWILAVDSDDHSVQLKWQAFFTLLISGLVTFFSGISQYFINTNGFYANATGN